ncbi:hypothetical protein CRV08_05350 [Halarcobacter ebronensis]|uniref:Uncharacterized protein n=1 Tax=Halarcobacter ebronensis TaxID=1462615 RepID=A0A4Q0YFE9_9BACT|nr:hypothetical protein [Halarcobacter ebronensis]RXJ68865.1 hypothetical protein CRV08_05350 [Halarcobacter ebronensis]
MEIMGDAVITHVYTIYLFFAIILFNLFSVTTIDSHIKLAKRLKFMTPIYHLCNAVVIYTGAIVAAYSTTLSIKVALMIPTSIFLMVLEIKRYKKMRVIKSNEVNLQLEFREFAKKIYLIEIFTLIIVYTISKVL